MLMEADRLPIAPGVNVIPTTQLPPAAIVLGDTGQLLVSAKSPGLLPITEMLVMDSSPFPVLVRVTTCDGLVVATA